MIWLPMVCTGDSDVIGSWKIIEMSLPRIARISGPRPSSTARSTGGPLSRENRIRPATIRPGGGTMRRMLWAVTLLPQPLSPMMPSVRLAPTWRLTPSTALSTPSSSWK